MKNKGIRKIILKVLKTNFGISMALVVVIIGVVLTSLIPPQILRYIIDESLVKKDYGPLLWLSIAYFGVLLFSGLFDFIKEGLLTILGQKLTREIRVSMMGKMEKVNALFFTENGSGAVVSRFTNDVEAINSLFTGGIIGMLVDCFKVIGIVISIWLFSSELGFMTLVILPVIYVITRQFQKRMLKAQIENRIIVGKVNNHLSESLKNIRMVKVYSKEKYMEDRFKNYLDENYQTVEKVNFYDSVFSPIIQLARTGVIAAIVLLSTNQSAIWGITIGVVAASIDLITNLFTPIENLGMELQNIQQAVSGIRRVQEFLSEKEFVHKLSENDDMLPSSTGVELAFNDVSFRYSENTEVLQNISLNFRPQENVTFVGRTGVGKTTLFKLIMGLLEPTFGSITINGIDVLEIPNAKKRRIFGYVDQNIHIISGTVADQVSLRDESITKDQISKALAFVGLADYVASLEKGMDTVVANDSLFSQGQRQLLAIARAIVTEPPILLLDEITANLDSITEEKILSVLKKAGENHTILSISHRMSSLINSDTVVILENGRVKNVGSPEELLKTDEWYRSHMELEKLTWN
jgi:ATP-binding cassette subfamily B protein